MSDQENNVILFIWFALMVVVLAAVAAVVIWALLTNQFKDQDKARYLALDAEIRENENV
jgi:nitrogen fixation-related uncharacterized protein